MAIRIPSPAELNDYIGQPLGTSDWLEVTQDRINMFADATDDHQWIHVDEEKAAAGPFGKTIAHGYLTLALAAPFMEQILQVDNVAMAINYGLNRARFMAPVPVGSRVRATGEIADVQEKGPAYEVVVKLTYEVEGGDKPPCVAEIVVILQPT